MAKGGLQGRQFRGRLYRGTDAHLQHNHPEVAQALVQVTGDCSWPTVRESLRSRWCAVGC